MGRFLLASLLLGACTAGGSTDAAGGSAGTTATGGTGDTGTATGSTTAADDGTASAGGTAGTASASTSAGGTTGGGEPWDDPVPDAFLGCEGGPTGTIYEATPSDDLSAIVAAMVPGDTLRLAPGTYTGGLRLHGLVGAPGACFYFESQDPNDPARFLGSSSRNTVSLADSRYVVVRNLELDGDGQLGDAVKAEGTASFVDHVVIEGLWIHDHDADQQVVGINTKCPVWAMWIKGNRIEGAGTGMYLGDSDGSAPFVQGLIEHNLVTRTLGYNLQIKHQNALPDVAGLPTGPTETIVRHNVLSKAEGANGGALARPNLLIGHVPPTGPGSDNRYLVYGNFLFDNPTEALLQAEGNVAIYANVLRNDAGPAVHVQPHNDVPRNIDVFGNTILAATKGLGLTGADPNAVQRVFGNVIFAETPLDAPDDGANLTGPRSDAACVLAAPDAAPGQGFDPHPHPGAPLPTADYAVAAPAMAHERDFDGRLRSAALAGAYDGPGRGDAWLPSLEPKP